MPSLSLRINLEPDGRIGPGKIELLEQIAVSGRELLEGRALEPLACMLERRRPDTAAREPGQVDEALRRRCALQ